MTFRPDHENVFKFVVLKSGQVRAGAAAGLDVVVERLDPRPSLLGVPASTRQARARMYTGGKRRFPDAAAAATLDALDDWARKYAATDLASLPAPELGPKQTGTDLARLRAALADDLLAHVLLGSDPALDVATALKLTQLALYAASGTWPVDPAQPAGDYVRRGLVVLPAWAGWPAAQAAPPLVVRPPAQDAGPTRLDDLRTAHAELTRLGSDERYRLKPEQSWQQGGEDEKELVAPPPLSPEERDFYVDPAHAESLSETTMQVLAEYGAGLKTLVPHKVLPLLEREIDRLEEQADLARADVVHGGAIPLRTMLAECMHEVGVGDLLMVKQKLKAYELAEIGHVENVLAGETKERVHRVRELREEVVTETEETETERARDLQSTDRNEMQSEAERTLREDLRIDAGLQVSGSYGPTVRFSASANASYARTTEESQRQAATFSREVTEKVSERVRERTARQRTRRLLNETEETNTHRVENAGDHVRGVYRWLDKVYDAQVFNYGKRMMYEFVAPEPGAFYLFARRNEHAAADDAPRPPEPPTGLQGPLRPADITTYSIGRYVAQYGVTDVPQPPPRRVTRVYTSTQEGAEPGNFHRAGTVAIPDGYAAVAVRIDYLFAAGGQDQPMLFSVVVGGLTSEFRFTPPNWSTAGPRGYLRLPVPYESALSVIVGSRRVSSFAVAVDVFCELTADGLAAWQQDAYDAVMRAYESRLAAYEDEVRRRAAREPAYGAVQGQHPRVNARLVHDELKKICVLMLRDDPTLDFDAYRDPEAAEPTIELDEACRQSTVIRFLENAFEWNNLTYVLYPYFWGRHSRWVPSFHLQDPDPEFLAFLRAGAARVQVPVRPGFERAVAYFARTGRPWLGGEPPLRDDDLYLPIVREISESLGRIEGGVPYPPGAAPWEVVVPTTLVVLQDLDEVPAIRDSLTGSPVTLLPERMSQPAAPAT